ncbi:hypothetical protein DFJ77DRAFT_509620 [Powellomyces hirtus]|nr:hypothetical protein DFJ77DRAFT_509620 [Powellomyces hirtus]
MEALPTYQEISSEALDLIELREQVSNLQRELTIARENTARSIRSEASLPVAPPSPIIPPAPARSPTPPAAEPQPKSAGIGLVPLQAGHRQEKRFYFIPARNIAAVLRSREVILVSQSLKKGVQLFVPDCFTVAQLVDRYLPELVLLPLAFGQGSLLVKPSAVVEVSTVNHQGSRHTSVCVMSQTQDGEKGDIIRRFIVGQILPVVVRQLDPENFPAVAQHLVDQDLGFGINILSGYS